MNRLIEYIRSYLIEIIPEARSALLRAQIGHEWHERSVTLHFTCDTREVRDELCKYETFEAIFDAAQKYLRTPLTINFVVDTSEVPSLGGQFYKSDRWLRVRYAALEREGAKCQCCARTVRDDRIRLHVDHIKPRSRFPELALSLNNLQVLCSDCNLGKSNEWTRDWRRSEDKSVASI